MTQNKEMLVLGLTGGIGSGKTLVLHMLETDYDAYVIEADRLAHALMEPGKEAYRKVAAAFGKDILAADGTIDRKRLGDLVFHDDGKLALLNQITHPIVKTSILSQIDRQRDAGRKLFVIEAALLVQGGYKEICDAICYVYAATDVRIGRLMNGRQYTRERALAVIGSQMSDDSYEAACDITLDNSGTPEETRENLRHIMNVLLAN